VRAVADDVCAAYPSATVSVEEREEMWIYVDDAFEYAITHTLENAVVHAERPESVVTVSVGPSPNTGRVEISVRDRNPRIPSGELDALFDRDGRSSVSHGSGVGLFVTKWCVESLGGEVEFGRRSPRGNEVSIYLPPKAPGSPVGSQ